MKFIRKAIEYTKINHKDTEYILIKEENETDTSLYITNIEYGIIQHIVTANKKLIDEVLNLEHNTYIYLAIEQYRKEYEDE